MHLLETPPEIFHHMIRHTLGVGDPVDDWQRLNKEIL